MLLHQQRLLLVRQRDEADDKPLAVAQRLGEGGVLGHAAEPVAVGFQRGVDQLVVQLVAAGERAQVGAPARKRLSAHPGRSEERRVGEEWVRTWRSGV